MNSNPNTPVAGLVERFTRNWLNNLAASCGVPRKPEPTENDYGHIQETLETSGALAHIEQLERVINFACDCGPNEALAFLCDWRAGIEWPEFVKGTE